MGGAAYVYLEDIASMGDAMALLKDEKGIESVVPGREAAELYNLHPGRIGHFFVLADGDTVFGSLPVSKRKYISVRMGPSMSVKSPIIGCGAGPMSVSLNRTAMWPHGWYDCAHDVQMLGFEV